MGIFKFIARNFEFEVTKFSPFRLTGNFLKSIKELFKISKYSRDLTNK